MTKLIVIALMAVGLVAPANAETGKSSEAGKQAAPAKPAKSDKAKKKTASKTKQTPFGPVAVTATPDEAPPARELSSDSSVSAEEQGELVIFRRKTPFGDQVWKKKKADLTADEQSILARGAAAKKTQPAQAKPAAQQTPKPDASEKP